MPLNAFSYYSVFFNKDSLYLLSGIASLSHSHEEPLAVLFRVILTFAAGKSRRSYVPDVGTGYRSWIPLLHPLLLYVKNPFQKLFTAGTFCILNIAITIAIPVRSVTRYTPRLNTVEH